MESPAQVPLKGDRYVPLTRTLAFLDLDFTAAVFKAQVRDRKNGGTVRADLATVTLSTAEGVRLIYADTDTVANHIAANRLTEVPSGYETTDSLLLSQIGIRINETTMEGMPEPGVTAEGDAGDDLVIWWDLHVTPSGGLKDVYAHGTFTVRGGVTQ